MAASGLAALVGVHRIAVSGSPPVGAACRASGEPARTPRSEPRRALPGDAYLISSQARDDARPAMGPF